MPFVLNHFDFEHNMSDCNRLFQGATSREACCPLAPEVAAMRASLARKEKFKSQSSGQLLLTPSDQNPDTGCCLANCALSGFGAPMSPPSNPKSAQGPVTHHCVLASLKSCPGSGCTWSLLLMKGRKPLEPLGH